MILQKQPQTNQSGFTIIECLMAILVVGALMTAIAPVIAISVATRLQAKRVEAGTQAAKNYIDGVRGGAIAAPNAYIVLNELSATGTFASQRDNFAKVVAPNTTLPACGSSVINPIDNPSDTPAEKERKRQIKGYCRNSIATPPAPYASTAANASLYCVDLDGDGGCTNSSDKDLIVQGFRSVYTTGSGAGLTTVVDADKGYILGVRVYRAAAFRNDGALLQNRPPSSGNNAPAKRVTQGTAGGDVGLRTRKAPLLELTTEITPKAGTSFDSLCARFGIKDSSGSPIACP